MRILLVSVHFAPAWIEGGVTLSSWNMSRGLARAGATVRVITTDAYLDSSDVVEPVRTEEGLEIRTVPIVRALGHAAHRYGLAPGLGRAVREALPSTDLCMVQGTWAWPAATASRICRGKSLPYLLCARGTLERVSVAEKAAKKRLYMRLVAARMLRQAAAVYFASESELANSREMLGETRGLALPHGFDEVSAYAADKGALRRRIGAPAESLVMGLAGRIHPRKGFHVILPALARCSDRVHLVAFGPDLEGNLERTLQLAVELGVDRRFHYLGYLERAELRTLYASLDLLVLPSFGESFGNVVIESLQQGTEVMVSDRVALAGYVREAGLGRVVRSLEPSDWSEAIEEWVEAGPGFDGRRAARRVREDYGLERCGRRMLEALEPLASRSP